MEPQSSHSQLVWLQPDPRVCTSSPVSMCRTYCYAPLKKVNLLVVTQSLNYASFSLIVLRLSFITFPYVRSELDQKIKQILFETFGGHMHKRLRIPWGEQTGLPRSRDAGLPGRRVVTGTCVAAAPFPGDQDTCRSVHCPDLELSTV